MFLRSSVSARMLAFIAIFLSSSVRAQNNLIANEPSVFNDPLDKLDRRVDIHLSQPPNGIKTGIVIAYGHKLPAPYRIEYRDNKLLINGVQVKPSIAYEKELAMQVKLTPNPKQRSARVSLWNTTVAAQDMARKGIAHEEILSFVRSQPEVRDVTWAAPGVLDITPNAGDAFEVELPIIGDKVLSNSEIKTRSAEAMRNEVQNIETQLKRKRCIIFVDGGFSSRVISKTFPAIIPKIMDDRSIDAHEKYNRLSAVIRGPAARDIIANYSSVEWK